MAEEIFKKKVYNKRDYEKTINTSFAQLGVKSIQEQQKQIAALKAENNLLKAEGNSRDDKMATIEAVLQQLLQENDEDKTIQTVAN